MVLGEMSYDAELLADIIDQGCPSPKEVACITGRHVNTVYAYRHGTINIPVDFWKQLFAHTRDPRIAALMFDGLPGVAITIDDQIPDLSSDAVSLRSAIESLGKFHDLQTHLAEIMADSEITADDAKAVAQYNHHYLEFMRHTAAVHAAVNKAFQRAAAAKE